MGKNDLGQRLGVLIALLDVVLTFDLPLSLDSDPGTEFTVEAAGNMPGAGLVHRLRPGGSCASPRNRRETGKVGRR